MEKSKIVTNTFPVAGMSCASCAVRVDKALNGLPGVESAHVNYASATARVAYRPGECSPGVLKRAVQAAGYDLLTDAEGPAEDEAAHVRAAHYRALKRRTLWAAGLCLPIVAGGMLFMDAPAVKYAVWALSTPVVFGLGREFFVNAWKQLRHGAANMDTLVAVSTGIAYLFSLFNLFFPEFWLSRGIEPHVYFESAAVIVAFILLGRLLEERAKRGTTTAIAKLMGLQPKTVTVITPSGERSVPVAELRAGDLVAVHPGERIAVDGTVAEGASYVDAKWPTFQDADGDGYPDNPDPAVTLAVQFANHPDYNENYRFKPVPTVPAVKGEGGKAIANPKIKGELLRGNIPAKADQEVHSADDILLNAGGPGSEYFKGVMDNTEVFFGMVRALGLDGNKTVKQSK